MIIIVLYNLLLMQVCLISATLPHEILEITSKFMTDPVRILVKRDELTLEVNDSWLSLLLCYQDLLLCSHHFPLLLLRM